MLFGRYSKPAPAPAAPAEPPVAERKTRNDGWMSPATGLGFGKASQGFFLGGIKLSPSELSALYYSDDLAARVVDAPVDEAFRVGYTLGGVDSDDAQKLYDAAEALDLDTHFSDAAKWGRLYGGAVLAMGILDGVDVANPLAQVTRSKPLAFLTVWDCREMQVFSVNKDIASSGYGQPLLYQIRGLDNQLTYIHASRLIRFDGIKVDKMKSRELGGWSYSVLQRVYDRLREFGLTFSAVNTLVQEVSQGVWSIEGLHEMLTSGEAGALMARMQMAEATKGVSRSIVVDAEKEKFERVSVSLAGVPEVLDRLMMRISAATGIPVALLMGRSAGGMNATGEGDENAWFATVRNYQEKDLGPKLLQVYRRLAQGLGIASDSLTVEWAPLKEANAAELADIYQKTAAADKTYIEMGVFEPEQVTLARAGAGYFDPTTAPRVDIAALEASLATLSAVEESGKLEITPSDLATVTTVGEARASVGLDPLPNAEDNNLTINAFKERNAAQQQIEGQQAAEGAIPNVGSQTGTAEPTR